MTLTFNGIMDFAGFLIFCVFLLYWAVNAWTFWMSKGRDLYEAFFGLVAWLLTMGLTGLVLWGLADMVGGV